MLTNRGKSIYERTAELLWAAELHKVTRQTQKLLSEKDMQVSLPGISQIRIAVWRAIQDDAVTLPRGQAYRTDAYDMYSTASETELVEEINPGLEYASHLYCITSKDKDEGILERGLNKLIGADEKTKNTLFIHTITPREAGTIFEYQSVTFVVVSVNGGKVYCLKLADNDNKGKILPEAALQSEYGELRDTAGPIDNCPIKAILCSAEETHEILAELQHVNKTLEAAKPQPEPTLKERLRHHLGRASLFGRTINDMAQTIFSSHKSDIDLKTKS